MNAKEFDALVNKGAVTQVGIVADAEKLDAKDFTDLHMTQHEVVAEVLAEEVPTEPIEEVPAEVNEEVPAEETPIEPVVEETPVAEVNEVAPEIAAEPVAMMDEVPVEEVPAVEATEPAPAKKARKGKNAAPSVDPVE